MEKIHLSKLINEPREKVWDTMLNDKTYREWTSVFDPSSRYEGEWREGASMRFLGGSSEEKGVSGMVSRIKDCRKPEYVAIEHLGILNNGVEDYTSEEVKKWAPSMECYTFNELGNSTEVVVDMDIQPEFKEQFEELWTKALEKLREVAERG